MRRWIIERTCFMPLLKIAELDSKISLLRKEITDGKAKPSTFTDLENLIDERIALTNPDSWKKGANRARNRTVYQGLIWR